MAKRKRKQHSWKKRALTVLCVFLGMILGTMIVSTAYLESLLGRINRPDTESISEDEIQQIIQSEAAEATGTGPVLKEEDIETQPTIAAPVTGADTINIMLIGQDARPGDKRSRSDAMILCTIRKSDNSLTMTSFLRDIYVKIPGRTNKNKLNTAYMFGGMELLSRCMKDNFGIIVDNTVEVDFNGFMEIIDIMGGVEIELTKQEASFMNSRGNWEVTKEEPWNLKEGKNLLTGSQALSYSRIRYIGTDFARVERQKKVLTALIDKVRDMNLVEMNNLVNRLVSLITTDMTNAEITGYVLELFPMLKDLNVVTQRVPLDNTYKFSVISGVGDSIIMDFETNLEFLRKTLGD